MKKIICLIIIAVLILCGTPLRASDQAEDAFLDKVQKQAFGYFLENTSEKTGLTLNTTEAHAPATNAATGFMLSSLIIGVERGWITKEKAYSMALRTLKTYKRMEYFNGFNYHYFSVSNGARMWSSEVSCIDTGLFLAGVITIGEYFKDTEVSAIADELFRRTDWGWFLNNEYVMQMSWKPNEGFSGRIDSFSEGILSYILAMGSPTHPIPRECWDSFIRPVSKYGSFELIYVSDGSLFQYLFPLAWLDLRDKHDKYADYWQNAKKAVYANKKYCLDNENSYATYREGFWGLSASLSPSGYKNFGALPGRNKHNGTVAPYAVAGSIPLVPEFAIANYRYIYDKLPSAVAQYGLTDAFNVDRRWVSPYYISIDQGLTLLMIENYRSGVIWKYFMRNDYVKKGLEAAGFVPGRQDQPSEITKRTGNAYDTISVKTLARNISIDGDLSDWTGSGAARIFLTSKDNRNVEMTMGHVRDDSDISGQFFLGYDDKCLYIAGHVMDDDILSTKSGNELYKDDCVEIFFDTNGNGFFFDGNPNDYQLGIAPSGPGLKPQIWAWGYVQKVPDNIRYAVKPTKNGYDIEVRIPFDDIRDFGPGRNLKTGYSISIHDRDKYGKSKKLTWSIDSASQPGRIFFGTMQLVD